jgi:hypothetical protein
MLFLSLIFFICEFCIPLSHACLAILDPSQFGCLISMQVFDNVHCTLVHGSSFAPTYSIPNLGLLHCYNVMCYLIVILFFFEIFVF